MDVNDVLYGIIKIRGVEMPPIPALLFTIFCTSAVGCNLVCLFNCFVVCILGPGLALRGPDGSLQQSVDGMQAERVDALRFFTMGLIFFHLTIIAGSYCYVDWPFATAFSVVLLFSLYKVSKYAAVNTHSVIPSPRSSIVQ